MLTYHIEALLFASPTSIGVVEIHTCLKEMFEANVTYEEIEKEIEEITQKYEEGQFAFGLVKSGGGFQFLTKPAYQASIGILLKQRSKKRLSNSAMETMAIIAYKQPITKTNIEQIRGVNCDYAVQKLLEKELIQMLGKAESIGRPILYGTSEKFMDYFGINDLDELPAPKDFVNEENTIGNAKE